MRRILFENKSNTVIELSFVNKFADIGNTENITNLKKKPAVKAVGVILTLFSFLFIFMKDKKDVI